MIGVFDSGIGGLSVLRALVARAPNADIVYFGDTINAPYGPRSRDELITLTAAAIDRLISAGTTEIVSACNSVSVSLVLPEYDALGLEPVYIPPRAATLAHAGRAHSEVQKHATHAALLQMRRNLKVIEMVGPTSAYLSRAQFRDILVVATEATVRSHMYQETLGLFGIHPTMLAIPALAGLLEKGASDAEYYESIKAALAQLSRRDFEAVVLGCTHYPFSRHAFVRALKEADMDAIIVDPAEPVAERAAAQFNVDGSGTVCFILSKDSAPFRAKVTEILQGRKYSIEII